jgi:hypothetical protein
MKLLIIILSLISSFTFGITVTNNSDKNIVFAINQSNDSELCESSIIEQQSGTILAKSKITLHNQNSQQKKYCIIINNNLIRLFLWDIRCEININNEAKQISTNDFCNPGEK